MHQLVYASISLFSFFTCTPASVVFFACSISFSIKNYNIFNFILINPLALKMVLSRSLQKSSSFNTNEEIEEDPFGYILSSNLSAGIRNDKSPRSPSPFWIKASSSSISNGFSSFSSSYRLVKVKGWILRIESWYLRGGSKLLGNGKHHQTSENSAKSTLIADDGTTSCSTTTAAAQVRGRSSVRTSSADRAVHHKMRATPERQHLWRKPSDRLWPVLEESEDVTTI